MTIDGSKYRRELFARIREEHVLHCEYCDACEGCWKPWPCDTKQLHDLFMGWSIKEFYERNASGE